MNLKEHPAADSKAMFNGTEKDVQAMHKLFRAKLDQMTIAEQPDLKEMKDE